MEKKENKTFGCAVTKKKKKNFWLCQNIFLMVNYTSWHISSVVVASSVGIWC